MAPLIEAVDVSKRFAGGLRREDTLALAGLSLAIDAEEPSIIAVVGESGSGKTTLARLLLGLIEPSGGEVRYRGADLRKLGRAERLEFRRDVQAIFQDPFEVFNRNIYVHIFHEPDPQGIIDLGIPVDHLMFGSDFPHPEGMADPLAYYEIVKDLPMDQQELIMGGSIERALKVGRFATN